MMIDYSRAIRFQLAAEHCATIARLCRDEGDLEGAIWWQEWAATDAREARAMCDINEHQGE